MDFNTIKFKMFKANINKYILFLICNIFSIAILYNLLTIALNEKFMNPAIVNPMISSNIYLPTFLILFFNFMFIPYSQGIFIKTRQKDYGILMTLGMSENEMISSTLIENFILGILSLIIGLAVGTFLSLFFSVLLLI